MLTTSATIVQNGVRAWCTIEDFEDDDSFVKIKLFIVPNPPGLANLAYERVQKKEDDR